MDRFEQYHMILRDVSFRAHHYRSMARMQQLIVFLQFIIMFYSVHLDSWWVHPWLMIIQLASFGFAVWMIGRSCWVYMGRARKIGELEKALLLLGKVQNESQFEAAQEQISAAMNDL